MSPSSASALNRPVAVWPVLCSDGAETSCWGRDYSCACAAGVSAYHIFPLVSGSIMLPRHALAHSPHDSARSENGSSPAGRRAKPPLPTPLTTVLSLPCSSHSESEGESISLHLYRDGSCCASKRVICGASELELPLKTTHACIVLRRGLCVRDGAVCGL